MVYVSISVTCVMNKCLHFTFKFPCSLHAQFWFLRGGCNKLKNRYLPYPSSLSKFLLEIQVFITKFPSIHGLRCFILTLTFAVCPCNVQGRLNSSQKQWHGSSVFKGSSKRPREFQVLGERTCTTFYKSWSDLTGVCTHKLLHTERTLKQLRYRSFIGFP